METDEAEKHPFRRGELLEILASTAVLLVAGAILAPVVAHGKGLAFRVTCLERIGNLAESILVYSNSSDDKLPLAFAFDRNRQEYRWRTPVAYPAAWQRYHNPQHAAEDVTVWSNATLPYAKDDKNFLCSATDVIHLPGVDYNMARPLPAAMTYTYNGLMHLFPIASVKSPKDAILAWEGLGRVAINGYTFVNPVMRCSVDNSVFRDNGGPLGAMLKPMKTMDLHLRGFNVACVDGHARWISADAAAFGKYDEDFLPGCWFSKGGYPEPFRPDFEGGSSDGKDEVRFTPYVRP